MRADNLTRKTHFKKHTALPVASSVEVYDMTTEEDAGWGLRAMDDIAPPSGGDSWDIVRMPQHFMRQDDLFTWCAALIAESPTAGRLWARAAEDGWSVGTADLSGGGFYLNIAERQLLLDHFGMKPSALGRSPYFRNAFLTTLVRALRDIWHEKAFGAFEDTYGPEDVLMLERLRAADCDTVTLLAGWELRGAGYAEVWRHLLGTAEGDMAQVFTRFLERDPSALFDGSALAYAFRQWYADEARINGCDHETLESLDDILMASSAHNPFGKAELTAAIAESLSVLPDGTCYLAGLGMNILADPFFAGLNDPINQTHMFHLMYDLEVTVVNHVPFRDPYLARRIFPA